MAPGRAISRINVYLSRLTGEIYPSLHTRSLLVYAYGFTSIV